jgi:hypothetical protein
MHELGGSRGVMRARCRHRLEARVHAERTQQVPHVIAYGLLAEM